MIPRSVLRRFKPTSSTSSISSFLRTPASSHLQPRLLSQRIPAPARARIASRWYSDNTSPSPGEKGASDESLGDAAPASEDPAVDSTTRETHPMKKELEAKNKEVAELKDRYLRQVADFRNLQERTKKDMAAARDFAIQKFAKDLIESVDNFQLALSQVGPEKLVDPTSSDSAPVQPESTDPYKDLRQLHSGLKMVEKVLMGTLKKHGLERFDPSEEGEKFDPNIHEATFQAPQPDKQDETCFYTSQKGFTLNGRVVRPAKVGVVKNA